MPPPKNTLYFYQNETVHTVHQAQDSKTLIHVTGTPLAQCAAGSAGEPPLLLGCDPLGSVGYSKDNAASAIGTYSPYGDDRSTATEVGFTGQLKAQSLAGYLLGNGYRLYNPILMRFHSPDSLSPFAEGGINAYGYCEGDPINRSDPSGHMFYAGSSTSFSLTRELPAAVHISAKMLHGTYYYPVTTAKLEGSLLKSVISELTIEYVTVSTPKRPSSPTPGPAPKRSAPSSSEPVYRGPLHQRNSRGQQPLWTIHEAQGVQSWSEVTKTYSARDRVIAKRLIELKQIDRYATKTLKSEFSDEPHANLAYINETASARAIKIRRHQGKQSS